MSTGQGQVLELFLEDGYRYARLSCPPDLVPAPGQYLLAGDSSDSPLPVPLFYTDSAPGGFIATATLPEAWQPGVELHLRGPLGRGFALPPAARKVGLVALDDSLARLRGLIRPSLKQGAAVVLVCDSATDALPDEVEVQPLSAMGEIAAWADYLAFDVRREKLDQLKGIFENRFQLSAGKAAQVLVRALVSCGGFAECGICAVTVKSGWKMACKDGPVFDLRELELKVP